MSESNRERYQRLKRAGLCVACAKVPAKAGRVRCEPCLIKIAALANTYYIKNKEERLQASKEYMSTMNGRAKYNLANRRRRLRIKQEAINAYGEICACCGEATIEFLTLDHINGDGLTHRKALMSEGATSRLTGFPFYKKLRELGYPRDVSLQVLCANCHIAKDKYGACPHRLDCHI